MKISNILKGGVSPKQSLDIGGIIPNDTRKDLMDEASNKWDDFIKSSFEGKTISGMMEIKPPGSERRPLNTPKNIEKKTQLVREIIGISPSDSFMTSCLRFYNENNGIYDVALNKKIFVN